MQTASKNQRVTIKPNADLSLPEAERKAVFDMVEPSKKFIVPLAKAITKMDAWIRAEERRLHHEALEEGSPLNRDKYEKAFKDLRSARRNLFPAVEAVIKEGQCWEDQLSTSQLMLENAGSKFENFYPAVIGNTFFVPDNNHILEALGAFKYQLAEACRYPTKLDFEKTWFGSNNAYGLQRSFKVLKENLTLFVSRNTDDLASTARE